MMDKTKLLTIVVIGLLLLNLGTLCFLFLNGPGGRPEPKEIIAQRLHFDEDQNKAYEKLIQWHRSEITRLDGNIRQAKDELYGQLSQPEPNIKSKDSIVNLLGVYQKQIEETNFRHFLDIKHLCHPNQLDDFNALTAELGKMFARQPRKRPHE